MNNNNLDDDDDDDDNDMTSRNNNNNNDDNDIHLGFTEIGRNNILFNNHNWSEWDGGIIGGKPIWLDPINIINYNELKCKKCMDQMMFLLQIYCPLDSPSHAFHRCIYLFTCKKVTINTTTTTTTATTTTITTTTIPITPPPPNITTTLTTPTPSNTRLSYCYITIIHIGIMC